MRPRPGNNLPSNSLLVRHSSPWVDKTPPGTAENQYAHSCIPPCSNDEPERSVAGRSNIYVSHHVRRNPVNQGSNPRVPNLAHSSENRRLLQYEAEAHERELAIARTGKRKEQINTLEHQKPFPAQNRERYDPREPVARQNAGHSHREYNWISADPYGLYRVSQHDLGPKFGRHWI